MAGSTYSLFCIGNPLLDMQVRNGEKLLEKYDLKADNAILAEEKHAELYGHLFWFFFWFSDSMHLLQATMKSLINIK
jgi:hypothetical protein